MDREHVKGAADKVKGAIKEGAGKLTGDRDLEAEGKWDKAKGDAHRVAAHRHRHPRRPYARAGRCRPADGK